jgi:hypothetical protein
VKGLRQWLVALTVAATIGLSLVVGGAALLGENDERFWPDPREREGYRLRELSHRLQVYARDHGGLPQQLSAVDTTRLSVDPWKTMVRYSANGPILELRSAGPDGQFDTDDDVIERDGTTYASKRDLYLARQDSARRHR